MSIYDWNTNSVTLQDETVTLDRDNPVHQILTQAARDFDMYSERIASDAARLARSAERIAEAAEKGDMSLMAGLGYEQLTKDIAEAQAKREALNTTLGIAFNAAKGAFNAAKGA